MKRSILGTFLVLSLGALLSLSASTEVGQTMQGTREEQHIPSQIVGSEHLKVFVHRSRPSMTSRRKTSS